MTANERRMEILYALLERRHLKLSEIQSLYCISRSTAKRDVRELSVFFPIYSENGRYGGIYVVEGFKLGMRYLTDKQCLLLERLSVSLVGEDLELMREILKIFRRPILRA